jgi:hypothetical protein
MARPDPERATPVAIAAISSTASAPARQSLPLTVFV